MEINSPMLSQPAPIGQSVIRLRLVSREFYGQQFDGSAKRNKGTLQNPGYLLGRLSTPTVEPLGGGQPHHHASTDNTSRR